MSRSITNLRTLGASTVTATFTEGLSDHSLTSPNLICSTVNIISTAYQSNIPQFQILHVQRLINFLKHQTESKTPVYRVF